MFGFGCTFSHKWSTWFEMPQQNFQERQCERCNFIERKTIVIETSCDGKTHRWDTWKMVSDRNGYDTNERRRTCKDCNWSEYKRVK